MDTASVKNGLMYAILFIFVTLMSLNAQPVWVPSSIDENALLNEVSAYNSMSDTQLRGLLDNQGKYNQDNIDMVFITYDFALLYQATNNIEYARKANVLLDRYAEVFPNWELDYSDNKGHSMWWEDWFHRDLGYVARFLAQAFDMTRYSNVYDNFPAGTENKIYDFLKLVVKVDLGYRLYVFNAAGSRPLGLIVFGRVLHDPELVHLGYWYYSKMLYEAFSTDGYWYEAVYGYMTTVVRDLQAPEYKYYLDGYSDPAGFSHTPIDERYDLPRIDNLNFDVTFGDCLVRSDFILWETALPDHNWPVMNETQAFPSGYNNANPRDYKDILQESYLMNGVGHAALAHGSGSTQTQVRLDFSHAVSHIHEDALHLIYYDKGEEVLGGTGYSYVDRAWNANTANQNLVMVNGQQQKSDYWANETMSPYVPDEGRIPGLPTWREYPMQTTNMHNNVMLFEPGYQGNKTVQVTEADALNAYDHIGVDRYSRMCALVNISGNDSYLIDFFRVKGGTRYDWNVHGGHVSIYDPRHPSYDASTSLSMGSASGSLERINFTNSASTSNNWYGQFDYNGVINRFHMAGRANTTVYKGRAPQSVQDATDDQDYIVVRRQASASDDENFLVVHETFEGSAHVQSIEELEFAGDPGTAVGLKIVLDNNTVDYVVHTLDEGPSYPTHTVLNESNFVVNGRFAHIRTVNGQVVWMQMHQGGSLSFADRNMSAAGGDYSYRGNVNLVNRIQAGANDNSFIVNVNNLPNSGELNGKTVIVTWGNGWKWGYKIQSAGGNKIVLAEEPGFDYNGSGNVKMKYFPAGEWPGPVSFIIPGTAIMDEQGNIASTKSSEFVADEFSPYVLNSSPANNAVDADADGQIAITFNEAMNVNSVESAISIQPSVNFNTAWNNNQLVITPTVQLASATTYAVTIASTAVDLSGNALDGNGDGNGGDAYQLSFTTNSPPEPFYQYVEAEDAITLVSPMQVYDDPLTSGGQYLGTTEGVGNNQGEAAITFTVPYNDTYYMWGLVSAPTVSDDSYIISINNDYDRIWDVLYEGGHTADWTWDQIAERGTGTYDSPQYDPATFELTAGTHTLYIKNREDGTMIDQLIVTNVASFDPNVQQPLSEIQFELPMGYSTISVPLRNDDIQTADDLAMIIETQLGENTVNGLSYWNVENQRYVSYAPHLPSFLRGTNFDITCGLPVLINTSLSGVWVLTGEMEDFYFTLQPGYNLISLELDKDNITDASELAAAIEAELGENTVNGLSYWDKAGQRWVSYAPHLPSFLRGTNFATSPGESYLINVMTDGNF